ncbi:MAG: type I-C CRISPR-associated protein Cas8c/Csd1 [Bacteroidetes bacterium]|nr:type I-C CRISPR-associated protein Cas8c/Csd1 [Bacteroidota bacterium]
MNWLSELSTVYDSVIKNKKINDKPLPLYHITNNAPLEITLDGKGKFRSARLLGKAEKSDWQTCMPCTEKSAARAGDTVAPYPFCDKLEYVAGDYGDYCDGKKLKDKYSAFLKSLGDWAQSDYSDPKINSVYEYVKKGTLVKDILNSGKIPEMDTVEKITAGENNVFIRWNVEIPEEDSRTWLDSKIYRLWIDYYSRNCPNHQGFCYISGNNETIAGLHSKKIRNSGDGAKLISSNDDTNYTFRGRFTEAAQACQVGMNVSIKAHNALRWLIQKQGTTIGNGLTIVAWCSASDIKPQLLKSSHDLWSDDTVEQDNYFTSEKSANTIKNRLLGYYGKLHDNDKILIMALNAATPGRMSILLYREFMKSDFYDAQEYWHIHLAWFYTYWKKGEKSSRHTISAPSPEEIAKTAYGVHISDSAKSMTIQRLLSCIIDKAPIPSDIEQLCFSRASRLNTLDSSEREKTLETACAVIKYNLYAREKEDINMGLDEDQKDRDYLYGRLLAVADKIESVVLEERGENRESNAVRYMQRFAKYPYSTWDLLYKDKLRPYMKYLKQMHPKLFGWYEGIIQNISDKFTIDEFSADKALSGKFLLGYHCQQKDFWRKREKDQSVNGNKQEE